MRTVFAKILVWSFGTLVVSLGAYLFISTGHGIANFRQRRALRENCGIPGGPSRSDLSRREVRRHWTPILRKLQTYFGPEHYFTDAQGKDLVTGVDRSALLATARAEDNVPHIPATVSSSWWHRKMALTV